MRGSGPVGEDEFASWLLRQQVLDPPRLQRARQRQRVYGGSLDTAILELGLGDEATLARTLSEASGLPPPEPAWLDGPLAEDMTRLMDGPARRKLAAQPVAIDGDRLQVVVGPGASVDALADWAAAGGIARGVRCYVVPLVRLEALWATLHGTPMPARYAALLGKLGGARAARRSGVQRREAGRLAARKPPVETGPAPERPRPVPSGSRGPDAGADSGVDLIMDIVEDDPTAVTPPPSVPTAAPRSASGPVSASDDESLDTLLDTLEAVSPGTPEHQALLRRLRPHTLEPRAERVLAVWRERATRSGEDAQRAIAMLGEVADRRSVEVLLVVLGSDARPAREAALAALRTATRHDLGAQRWRWNRWWKDFGHRHRVEWLLDALDGRDAQLRLAAAQELEKLSGRYVGYHFDLGKRERDQARHRWQQWWEGERKKASARP